RGGTRRSRRPKLARPPHLNFRAAENRGLGRFCNRDVTKKEHHPPGLRYPNGTNGVDLGSGVPNPTHRGRRGCPPLDGGNPSGGEPRRRRRRGRGCHLAARKRVLRRRDRRGGCRIVSTCPGGEAATCPRASPTTAAPRGCRERHRR